MGQVFYYRSNNTPREEIVVSGYGQTSNDIPSSTSRSDDINESTSLLVPIRSTASSKKNPQTRFIIRLFFLSSVLLWLGLLGGSAVYFFGSGKKIDMSQWHIVPQLLGWGSAILYCASRIPQIMQNFRNESVEGLSLVMFIFSVVGNLTYCVVRIILNIYLYIRI